MEHTAARRGEAGGTRSIQSSSVGACDRLERRGAIESRLVALVIADGSEAGRRGLHSAQRLCDGAWFPRFPDSLTARIWRRACSAVRLGPRRWHRRYRTYARRVPSPRPHPFFFATLAVLLGAVV